MSSTPKYSDYELEEQTRQRLEEARRRQAEEEAHRRWIAEEQERQRLADARRRQAEEEARLQREAAEREQQRLADVLRRQVEEEARLRRETEERERQRLAEVRRRQAEEEARLRQEAMERERLRLEEERQRRVEEESRRRWEAEERERLRRLNQIRTARLAEAREIEQEIIGQKRAVHGQDAIHLAACAQQLLADLGSLPTEHDIQLKAADIIKLRKELLSAVERKRRDDAEQMRLAELEKLRRRMFVLAQKLSTISNSDASRFDPNGVSIVGSALSDAERAIAGGDPASARQKVEQAEKLVTRHSETVAHAVAEWRRRKNAAETEIGSLYALREGMTADEKIGRWEPDFLPWINARLQEAQQAIAEERFEGVSLILTEARKHADVTIATANEAQLKADKRNFVAQGIADTLHAMGFSLMPTKEEHPGHPATALLVKGEDISGHAVMVNIPTEGEIWYQVHGFPHYSKTTAHGGTAKVCDEAEAVLDDMRERVQDAYGIQMGEIRWEGKDPDRILNIKKRLPKASGAKKQEGGR